MTSIGIDIRIKAFSYIVGRIKKSIHIIVLEDNYVNFKTCTYLHFYLHDVPPKSVLMDMQLWWDSGFLCNTAF